jgi:hypothetical protein
MAGASVDWNLQPGQPIVRMKLHDRFGAPVRGVFPHPARHPMS